MINLMEEEASNGYVTQKDSRERAISEPNMLTVNTVGQFHSPRGSDSAATATPQTSRKAKIAASIGKFFRPWKWKRKKKSDKFIQTSEGIIQQSRY